jgi:hypothetical protein
LGMPCLATAWCDTPDTIMSGRQSLSTKQRRYLGAPKSCWNGHERLAAGTQQPNARVQILHRLSPALIFLIAGTTETEGGRHIVSMMLADSNLQLGASCAPGREASLRRNVVRFARTHLRAREPQQDGGTCRTLLPLIKLTCARKVNTQEALARSLRALCERARSAS